MQTTKPAPPEPLLSEVMAAAIARALYPYAVVTTRVNVARGVHLYTRHPGLPLSLCGALLRARPARLLPPLTAADLSTVTCAGCLIDLTQRLAPQ
jgi:hypothetical protein